MWPERGAPKAEELSTGRRVRVIGLGLGRRVRVIFLARVTFLPNSRSTCTCTRRVVHVGLAMQLDLDVYLGTRTGLDLYT